MTNELTRAANAASEALGVDVLVGSWPDGNKGKPSRSVALFARSVTPMERVPFEQKIDIPTPAEALAYLEGLEMGARIMRERHARLRRSADDTYLWCCTYAQDFRLTDTCQSLKAALAELED